MNIIALDTYKTIQKLQTKGFPLEQAEGILEALTESELVTKSELTTALAGLRTDIYRALLLQTGAISAIVLGILSFTLT